MAPHAHRRLCRPSAGLAAAIAAVLAGNVSGTVRAADWPQWGGPTRDFHVDASGLADKWPAGGPERLWTRPLGEGYSAVVAASGRLYTMYREGDDEVVIALDAESGGTVWEHRYRAVPYPEQTGDFGQGPNAAPLMLGDRLITVGFTGLMNCLDAKSGRPLWRYDLVNEFSGAIQYYGYSNSPIAYKGTIITLVGGEKHGVLALDPSDGTVIWESAPSAISYAAPVMINVDGQDQLVFFTPDKVRGMDPRDGAFLWDHPVVNFCRTNCTSAIWGRDNLLWAATKGVGGTRVLRLSQQAGKTNVEEVWLNRKVRVYHWNALRIGDHVYTSIGDSAAMLAVIDVKTGEVVDRKRGLAHANGIYADGKLILLDHDGKLALAEIQSERVNIVSTAQVLDSTTWTPPTLAGTTLYVRDREKLIALDLG